MKKQYIIPIFVPHLGCPNECTFCNQRKISGQMKNITENDVRETIEYYLNNFKEKDVTYEELEDFLDEIYRRDFDLNLSYEEEHELSTYIFDKIKKKQN